MRGEKGADSSMRFSLAAIVLFSFVLAGSAFTGLDAGVARSDSIKAERAGIHACADRNIGAVSTACAGLDEGNDGEEKSGMTAQSAVSKNDSLPFYRISEIVVTADRESAPVMNVPQSVGLLNRNDVEWTLANSSTDLAGDLAGVFIERTGSFGRSDVYIRGLGSNGRRTTVMIDGRPEKMALFGCTITHSFLLHDVKRIEVVRGPASLLYGSGAMGGAINIITRDADEPFSADFKVGRGSFSTFVSTARAAGRKGGFFGALSADYRRSDGHVGHSDYRGKDFHLKGGVDISSNFKLTMSAKYFDGYKAEPLRITDFPEMTADTWNDYARGGVDLRLNGRVASSDIEALYYRNFGEHKFSDGFHSKDATDGFNVHLAARPISFLSLKGGIDYTYQQGKSLSEPVGNWNKWEAGAYLLTEMNAGERVVFSGGTRYDRDKVSGSMLLPSAGILVHPLKETTLRAFVSRGFRTPQISELYMYPVSNERLKAETILDYEVGVRQKIHEKAFFDLSLFRMDGKNLIKVCKNESPPPMFIFENAQSFRFDGIETLLDIIPCRFLESSISYTYLDVGDLTRGRPGRKLDVSVTLKYNHAMMRISGSYVGDYYADDYHMDRIDSYNVLDLYSEARLFKGAAVYFGVDNLLNADYSVYADIPGGIAGLYKMPGRSFMMGVKYSY